MWKIIYSMKKYWTFHIKSLWILLHWYWKQISFETNITSLWKIDFLILLLLHFIFTILLLLWKNRKLRLGVDRWRVEYWSWSCGPVAYLRSCAAELSRGAASRRGLRDPAASAAARPRRRVRQQTRPPGARRQPAAGTEYLDYLDCGCVDNKM